MPRRPSTTTYDVLTTAEGWHGPTLALARLLATRFGLDAELVGRQLASGESVVVVEGVSGDKADEVADNLTRIGVTPSRRTTTASGMIYLEDFGDEPPIPGPWTAPAPERKLVRADETAAPALPAPSAELVPAPEPARAPEPSSGWGAVLGSGAGPALPATPRLDFSVGDGAEDAFEDLLSMSAPNATPRSTALGLPAIGHRSGAGVTSREELRLKLAEPAAPEPQPAPRPAPGAAELRRPAPAPPEPAPPKPARRPPAKEPRSGKRAPARPAPASRPRRTPAGALIAGLLVPGGGQAYNGQTGAALLTAVLAPLVIPWFYGAARAYDAEKAGKVPPSEGLSGVAGALVHGIIVFGVWFGLVVGGQVVVHRLTAQAEAEAHAVKMEAMVKGRGEAAIAVSKALYRADREREALEARIIKNSGLKPGEVGFGLSPSERARRAQQLVATGKAAYGRGDYVACQSIMQEAIALDRTNKEAWTWSVNARQKLAEDNRDGDAPPPSP